MDLFHRGTVRLRLYHDDTRSMHDRANPWVGAARPDHGARVTENRISIWSVEAGAYGVDLPYHGASGYTDAETAEQKLYEAGSRRASAGTRRRLVGARAPAHEAESPR